MRIAHETAAPFPGPRSKRLPAWLPLALVLALAAALRFYHLGSENFWIDEVFSMRQVHSPAEQIESFWNLEDQMTSRPLGLVLVYLVFQLGRSEFLARLPYAILSLFDVVVLYLLARDLQGRRVALLGALFLALLPLHVWYGQEARWYAQWSFLATLSFWFLVRLWKSGRSGWWLGYLGATVVNLYTYVISAQLLAVQALAGWLLPDRGSRASFRWKFMMALIVAGILAVPVIVVALNLNVRQTGGVGVGTVRDTSMVALPYIFFSYVAGYSVGPTVGELHALPSAASLLREHPEIVLYYATFVPIAALGLWSLRRDRVSAAILAPWAVGMPLLVFVSALASGQTFNVRYTFAAIPGFALLLSLGVESMGRWRRAGIVAVVGLFAFSLINYYGNPRYDKEDVRAAIAEIRGSPHADEPVAVIGQGIAASEYYGKDLELKELQICTGREQWWIDGGAPEISITDISGQPIFWLVVSRDWEGRSKHCLERLEPTHEIARSHAYTGVDLYLMKHR